jgi:non-ribosomal peptide synthetase component F
MDGWSAPILVRELLEVYAQHGSAASLPRVTPYRDYLTFIARQDRAAGLAAWRQALDGLEEGTRLAPRQAGREPLEPEHIVLSVDPTLSASLNRTAREQALTLNTVMQAAWGILLGRLSGRDDVVFGVTVAGRPAELAGVEHMVGLFINTLPLRMQLRPELPLAALLRQTQDSQSRLMAHQHLGLAEIQQAAGVGDLFDTLLVFENYPVDRAGLAAAGLGTGSGTTGNGLKLGQVQGRDATHYPLALIVQPGETLQLRLDYRPDLFERASVEAIGRRLIRLLEAAVADAGQPLGHLPILEAAERDTILRTWNDTAHALVSKQDASSGDTAPLTLPALFAAQALRTPDAVAVVFEDRTLIYAALDAHANRLAHHLRDLGVGPDVLVGVCAERSLELVVGLLAVLKAGGAYVPLDPEYPAGRLTDMVSDAELRVVLLQGAAVEALPLQNGVTRIRLELDASSSALPSVSAPALDDLQADHLAYMIYTSGSTGKPKGAANTHAGLHNRLAWMQDA